MSASDGSVKALAKIFFLKINQKLISFHSAETIVVSINLILCF